MPRGVLRREGTVQVPQRTVGHRTCPWEFRSHQIQILGAGFIHLYRRCAFANIRHILGGSFPEKRNPRGRTYGEIAPRHVKWLGLQLCVQTRWNMGAIRLAKPSVALF